MEKIADGVYMLSCLFRDYINAYVIGDVLVDAGLSFSIERLRKLLGETQLRAHLVSHAHPDHQGGSSAICQALKLPLWCGSNDADAIESGKVSMCLPSRWGIGRLSSLIAGPGHPVARRLCEGDCVSTFRVIETPGHSPGHISLFRESDRFLIAGDVLGNINLLTGGARICEPPKLFTPNRALNIESARKLAQLSPRTICFGHGPPLRDGDHFVQFVGQL